MRASGPPDRRELRCRLSPRTRLAHSAAIAVERTAAHRAGVGAERGADRRLETAALAGDQKKAQKEGRTIVFIDESGLSQRPHRRRTWAPRGQTPVLQFHFCWKTLSVIAGITLWNFYFQMFEETIRSEQVILFLQHLLRYVGGDLLIVGDDCRPIAVF